MADTTNSGGNDTKDNKSSKNQTPPETQKQATSKGSDQAKSAEATYDIASLTEGKTAWTQFNYAPELVTAALKKNGKEQYTVAEAKEIVEAFAKKEVQ